MPAKEINNIKLPRIAPAVIILAYFIKCNASVKLSVKWPGHYTNLEKRITRICGMLVIIRVIPRLNESVGQGLNSCN